MAAPSTLSTALNATLGSEVTVLSPVSGGDINDAYRATLTDGRAVFVKTHRKPPIGMYTAEARGLRYLRGPHGLVIPEVLAVQEADGTSPAFLVLGWITAGAQGRDFAETLGRGLAALHRMGAAHFGDNASNFIGSLVQVNTPMDSWVAFYREARLRAQLELAIHQGRADANMRAGFERLFKRLPSLLSEPEAVSRLHGDLWGGNVMADSQGRPCLIDPAAYGGDREMDLALMRLFGGFTEKTFDAYAEAYPLRAGAEDRVALYQLYPLMVHVNLFGGHYRNQVQRILDRY